MKKLKGVEGEIVQFKNKFSQVCSGGQVWLGLFKEKKVKSLDHASVDGGVERLDINGEDEVVETSKLRYEVRGHWEKGERREEENVSL